MKEFESALAAAFEVGPAEVPGLAIDQLDGRPATESGPMLPCYTWLAEPLVTASVSPCLAERAEPVAATAG